ncbi:DnaD domain protein [Limosilactobacillus sp.]|uniref:DnaD domain protein n=1 Tax=Limosilactobacillus sp. TaxID=2773925 RepID=UPI003F046B74
MTEENALQRYIRAGQTTISNLLVHHYKQIGLTTAQLVLYLQFKSYQDRGTMNPDVRVIAKNLGTSETQVFNQLHQMMTNKLVKQGMRKLPDGKEDAIYDFTPLLNKLALLEDQTTATVQEKEVQNNRQQVFAKLESEFGRPLSSMELQIVNDWLDKDDYSAAMVELALRQAVMNSALNLQYMERILQSWAHQGLRTKRDIEEHERQFENRREGQSNTRHDSQSRPAGPKIPIYKLGE